jgi:hypothetical protein
VSRSTDPRFSLEGGRAFLRIPMALEFIGMGWLAFHQVEKALRRQRVRADELQWRYAEENHGTVIAVFEVVPDVR